MDPWGWKRQSKSLNIWDELRTTRLSYYNPPDGCGSGQSNMVSVEDWFQFFSSFRGPFFFKLVITFCRCPTKIPLFMPPFRGNGSNCSQKIPCVGRISVCRESHFSSLFSQSQFRRILTPFQTQPSLYLKWTKEKPREKNGNKNQRGTVRAKFWHMYIASLQFYKQMYNNYIINKLLIWDGEEPASHVSRGGLGWFFFSSFSFVTVWRSCERWRRANSSLRGVLVLLCAAAAEIHPTQVVPVRYPVVGAAFAVRRRVPAHRAFVEEKQGRRQKE